MKSQRGGNSIVDEKPIWFFIFDGKSTRSLTINLYFITYTSEIN